jgi:tetratricopeptide (TPR) repeat protein
MSKCGMPTGSCNTTLKIVLTAVAVASGLKSWTATGQSLPDRTSPAIPLLSAKDEGSNESACFSFGLEPTQEAHSSCDQFGKAVKAGQWELAAQSAQKLRDLYPKNGIGEFCQGYVELKRGRYIAAVRHFQAAVNRSPDVALAHLDLGLAFFALGQYKLFEEEMLWVIANKTNEALPYHYLGLYHSGNSVQFDRAAECFQEALNRNPSDFQSHYQLGKLLQAKGDLQGARASFETAEAKALSQGVAYGQASEGLAEISLRLGDATAGLRQAKMAVTRDPKSASARLLLGKLLVQRGETTNAIQELKASAALDPAYAAPHYWLSRAYQDMKLADAAKHELELFSRIKATYGNE